MKSLCTEGSGVTAPLTFRRRPLPPSCLSCRPCSFWRGSPVSPPCYVQGEGQATRTRCRPGMLSPSGDDMTEARRCPSPVLARAPRVDGDVTLGSARLPWLSFPLQLNVPPGLERRLYLSAGGILVLRNVKEPLPVSVIKCDVRDTFDVKRAVGRWRGRQDRTPGDPGHSVRGCWPRRLSPAPDVPVVSKYNVKAGFLEASSVRTHCSTLS